MKSFKFQPSTEEKGLWLGSIVGLVIVLLGLWFLSHLWETTAIPFAQPTDSTVDSGTWRNEPFGTEITPDLGPKPSGTGTTLAQERKPSGISSPISSHRASE